MIKKKWPRFLIVTCMTLMLTISSIGSAYISTVYAAPAEEEQTDIADETIKDKKKEQEKAALGGLLLVGLVSMLKKGSGDSNSVPKQSGSQNTQSSNQPTARKGSMSAEELQLINLINDERKSRGLNTLKANNQIGDVARAHSQDMANTDHFDHTNTKGQNPFDRLRAGGVTGWVTAGENIAINGSVTNAHNAFMNSPGHKANVLNSDYTEVGVGIIHDGGYLYVTENFIGR